MHIAIIGASGRVAKVAIQQIFLSNTDKDLQVTLTARDKEHVDGFCRDVMSAVPLVKLAGAAITAPKWRVTDNIADLNGSDLIVIAAAMLPTREDKAAFKKIDPTGRLGLSFPNLGLIEDLSQSIAQHAPQAHVLMVTNQSDMMAEVARTYLAPQQVLGVGGIIDSARFRHLVSQYPDAVPETGHMIGYHNDDMIPLSSSLTNKGLEEAFLSNCITATRAYGGVVSTKMKNKQDPLSPANVGATVAPGLAIAQIVRAFTGQAAPFVEAFNIRISDILSARLYGVPKGSALSLPIKIGHGKFNKTTPARLTAAEKKHLGAAKQRMDEGMATLFAHNRAKTIAGANL